MDIYCRCLVVFKPGWGKVKLLVFLFAFGTNAFFSTAQANAPDVQIDPLPSTVTELVELTGSANGDSAISEVYLSISHDNSGYYWNGSVFQPSPIEVLANLSGSGATVGWSYFFSDSLSAGGYTVTARSVDSGGIVGTSSDSESFAVTSYFSSSGSGMWGPVIQVPSIPVSAANLPDGTILTWAAYKADDFQPYGSDFGQTFTTIFNPGTGVSTLELVTETSHDMFCMGANILEDGRVLINGGNSEARTSIFDGNSSSWVIDDQMNIPRAYQGNTMLSDGRVLTLGGSWKENAQCLGQSDNNGSCSDKTAEVWDEQNGWTILSGIQATPLSTNDVDGLFRSDNHMWLFSVPGGKVLHAGPAAQMNLLDVRGNGSVIPAGLRANDSDAMNGNAVMFDIGKILTTGGAPNYENSNATSNAFVIDTDGVSVSARKIDSMSSQRAYHNSVVLPNGEVIVVGGQSYPVPFSDAGSAMMPELWNPVSESFRELAQMSVPRNYHSVALLTQDGKILAGGGGLCGNCNTNHSDLEILTPPYLFDADGNLAERPTILNAPLKSSYGKKIAVTTGSAIKALVLMRASAVTHSVNNAQRRIPLDFVRTAESSYLANIPIDSGAVIPGNYMLFALDANGVPSIARTINISHLESLDDVQKPNTVIVNPESGAVLDSSIQITFSGNATDTGGSGFSTVDLRILNLASGQFALFAANSDTASATLTKPGNLNNTNWFFSYTLDPGNYKFFARTIDKSGNSSSWITSEFTVSSVDLKAPKATIISPDAEAYAGSIVFAGNATESGGSGFSSIRIRVRDIDTGQFVTLKNGASIISATLSKPANKNNTNWTVTEILPVGNYRVFVRATDQAGNQQAWVKQDFTVINAPDNIAPVAVIVSPGAGVSANTNFVISGNATDTGGSGFSTVRLRILNTDRGEWEIFPNGSIVARAALTKPNNKNNTNWNYIHLLAAGNYRLFVAAIDRAGNQQAWVKRNFTAQ